MPDSKLLVIVGATGKQGSAVAKTFLQDPTYTIRALTRDPSKSSAQWLSTPTSHLAAANLDDPASLARAFAGANTIFAVTDFWQFMSDSGTASLAQQQGISLNEAAMNREVQQGKNLVDAAARVEGLETFVFSTLSDTRKWSNGTITENYHFDGKAEVERYLKERHPELAGKARYLQMGFYFDNWKMGDFWKPQKQSNGKYLLSVPTADADRTLPYVDPEKDTGTFVKALMEAPAGTTLLGQSDPMNVKQWAEAWGKANGVDCRFEAMSVEKFKEVAPPVLFGEIVASCLYTTKYGWAGGDPSVVEPKHLGVGKEKLATVENYIKSEDWSAILKA